MSCVGYMSCMRYAVGDYMGLGSGQTPGIIHRASPGLRVVSSASGFSVRNCDRVIPYLSCTRRPGVTLMLITLSLSPPPTPPLSDHSLSHSLSLGPRSHAAKQRERSNTGHETRTAHPLHSNHIKAQPGHSRGARSALHRGARPAVARAQRPPGPSRRGGKGREGVKGQGRA